MEPEYQTTAEVAQRLRLKERSVYELVRTRRIPCSRVAGKWLFPRRLVDAWVLAGVEDRFVPAPAPPAVVAGSHDPLLSWAVGASGCGLAIEAGGSFDARYATPIYGGGRPVTVTGEDGGSFSRDLAARLGAHGNAERVLAALIAAQRG